MDRGLALLVLRAFSLIVALIAVSPVLLVSDGLLERGLVAAVISAAAVTVGSTIRPNEAKHHQTLIRPVLFAAAVPAVWMLVQALPLPFTGVVNPIWASAQLALPASILGHISIDPGATVLSLVRYIAAITLLLVASAVAIDRGRAERLLFWLALISFAQALLIIVHDTAGFTFLGEIDGSRRTAVAAAAALGTVLCASLAARAFERYELRRVRGERSLLRLVEGLSFALIGLAGCCFAVFYFTTDALGIAVLSGLGVFIALMIFRRLGLGIWPAAAAAGLASLLVLGLVFGEARSGHADITLRFAPWPAAGTQAVRRALADAPPGGTGAGTLSALAAIYRGSGESADAQATLAPTVAAAITLELGWPALWYVMAAGLGLVMMLIRGALVRGRDSFYSAAAAGYGVMLMVEGFSDAALLHTSVLVMAMATLGLGLAQSASRKLQ